MYYMQVLDDSVQVNFNHTDISALQDEVWDLWVKQFITLTLINLNPTVSSSLVRKTY